MTFKDLQDELKRRATVNEGGTTFDTAIKNLLNFSLHRLAREAKWRVLRRDSSFDTVTTYDEGTGAVTVTEDSKNVTVTGATFLTDNIQPGRLVSLNESSKTFTIKTVTGETTFTVDINYDTTTDTAGSYSIYPQMIYNVPIQASHRIFLWHREWGYPYQLTYMTDQDFFGQGIDDKTTGVPKVYRMWGTDMVINQLKEASAITVVSSSASDTTPKVTIFGIVSGYPDYETITLTGTTNAVGSKSFTSVERVVKDASTTGRITVTGNSGNTTVAVLPTGDTTEGIVYRKISLYPLPNTVFPMQVYYYKDPYRLVNDADVHELGEDFDEALLLLATSKLKHEQNQKEGDKFYALYKDEVQSLRKTNVDKFDFFPTLEKPKNSRIGRIPSVFSPSQVSGGNWGYRIRG